MHAAACTLQPAWPWARVFLFPCCYRSWDGIRAHARGRWNDDGCLLYRTIEIVGHNTWLDPPTRG
eukprot:5292504-Prymnesium_polylepis.1